MSCDICNVYEFFMPSFQCYFWPLSSFFATKNIFYGCNLVALNHSSLPLHLFLYVFLWSFCWNFRHWQLLGTWIIRIWIPFYFFHFNRQFPCVWLILLVRVFYSNVNTSYILICLVLSDTLRQKWCQKMNTPIQQKMFFISLSKFNSYCSCKNYNYKSLWLLSWALSTGQLAATVRGAKRFQM